MIKKYFISRGLQSSKYCHTVCDENLNRCNLVNVIYTMVWWWGKACYWKITIW